MKQAPGLPCNHWLVTKAELLAINSITHWKQATLNQVYDRNQVTYQLVGPSGQFAGNYIKGSN